MALKNSEIKVEKERISSPDGGYGWVVLVASFV